MSFIDEQISSEFGVDGVIIKQTLFESYDVFSALNVQASAFQNTRQSLESLNQDGRIELGMFYFNDDNLASDNFPDILSLPFSSITKTNMVNNGDCKFVEKNLIRYDDNTYVVQPEGEWRFLSLFDITHQNFLNNYNYPDPQNFQGYGGRYNYVPLSLELDNDDGGFNYWGKLQEAINDQDFPTDTTERLDLYFMCKPYRGLEEDLGQKWINDSINGDYLSDVRTQKEYKYLAEGPDSSTWDGGEVPTIATWIRTTEAYSNNKCLAFQNFQVWNQGKVNNYVRPGEKYIFNWLSEHQSNGFGSGNVHTYNQYRTLNQYQKIYDKFEDEPINPYSSLKIRFKMKTTHVLPSEEFGLINQENPLLSDSAPEVEVGILQSQFNEAPKSGINGIQEGFHGGEERFKAPGSWNSERYFNGDSYLQKRDSRFGGMGRFKNSIMDEWETFEFNFNLRDEHNNRGKIYGVPYGGSFEDSINGGATEILINANFDPTNKRPNIWDGTTEDSQPAGEVHFKVPGYQTGVLDELSFRHPDGNVVTMSHGPWNIAGDGDNDYMSVATSLGDTGGDADNPKTGLQEDGKIIESYLMYVGDYQGRVGNNQQGNNNNFNMDGGLGYSTPDIINAFWDGERWYVDTNRGLNLGDTSVNPIFDPGDSEFILARLYASTDAERGITSIEQYVSNEAEYPTDGIGNLFLFLQTGNEFQGRVLIDDIECYESYEFYPEVDVRKKISVGNYGKADLTQYYDKELHPTEYKDSQAPLEAQFYFYPQYPTNELFDTSREPIYQDFKQGKFYIYDVNWGDGTSNEFTSTPEQIDENTALYHTYETSGIFEVTGTMIRVKTDSDNNIVGVAHNKKFSLRININEGLDEDFKYFGSDGFSFIPYKNSLPIIGGISKQSNYYKKIKRQLGFLNNDEKMSIEFKNKSDKLKTELALLKMENQDLNDLEILPSYMIERFDNADFFREDNWLQNVQKNGVEALATYVKDYLSTFPSTNPYFPSVLIPIWNASRYYQSFVPDGITLPEDQMMGPFLYENDVQIVLDWLDGNGFGGYEGWDEPYGVWYCFNLGIIYVVLNSSDEYIVPMPIVPNELMYNGISPIKEELGKGIGDCDLTNIKFYNKPKFLYELLGFDNEQGGIFINTPNNPRYWKNIIPKDYSIFNREGLDGDLIDTYSEQDWIDENQDGEPDYYYPVLPKYGQDGNFIETMDEDGNYISDTYPNNKIPFPINGPITDEFESDESLLINVNSNKLDIDVLDDSSGNKNYGFTIEDYKTEFDDKTLKVKQSKKRAIFKSSKTFGAF